MVPFGGDQWTVGTYTDPDVDFTTWVLQRDGLRAGAFRTHPDGDGRLRHAGLTAADWVDWFHKVVRIASREEEDIPSEEVFIGEPPTEEELLRHRDEQLAQTAAGRFAGPESVRTMLLDLRPEFDRRNEARSEREFARLTERGTRAAEVEAEAMAVKGQRVWKDLQAYRPLPPLHFYLVEYVVPVVSVVPPSSAVIGLVDPREDDVDSYAPLMFEAARRLKQAGDSTPLD